ncbi:MULTISPECIES: hypothetical protein [unclassified Modicisalibacter]|uniref:hypothetical protein n=1 Tax=unclassified Modicisalibacter TaxID=2679913 RepID=UPI001CC9E602|nr:MULTISPECIES: hypothetical protein [unclassified Modicisalibacter]MBZ9558106.1 hypothetical protein [Modicisalibacter sp. R2A 31.J]MBZ9573225.1 hypothetical protein [Modicisalibacter sp. MOD 31.J]
MSRFAPRLPARLAPLWAARSGREKGLLVLALVGVLAYAGHAALSSLPAGSEPFAAAKPGPNLLRLPPITPVDAATWRSAAVEQGLALTRIEVTARGITTHGEAPSPEAFSDFARWAAQHGWWAVAWQLERREGQSLALAAHWRSQLERPASEPASGAESNSGPVAESAPLDTTATATESR